MNFVWLPDKQELTRVSGSKISSNDRLYNNGLAYNCYMMFVVSVSYQRLARLSISRHSTLSDIALEHQVDLGFLKKIDIE